MVAKSAPPSHVSGGTVFRFEGFGDLPGAALGLPLVPVRLGSPQQPGGFIVNAVLDSGATRTMIPFDLAEDLALANLRFEERIATGGGDANVAPADVRLEIVDSYFPSVVHWRFDHLPVNVAQPPVELPVPLIGWDVLRLFDTCMHPKDGFIILREGKGHA